MKIPFFKLTLWTDAN